jgi:hypothetical protein
LALEESDLYSGEKNNLCLNRISDLPVGFFFTIRPLLPSISLEGAHGEGGESFRFLGSYPIPGAKIPCHNSLIGNNLQE